MTACHVTTLDITRFFALAVLVLRRVLRPPPDLPLRVVADLNHMPHLVADGVL